MMKLSDDRFTTSVKQMNLPCYSYVTTCGTKIYQTTHNTSTVTCYTKKGEQLWEYKDASVLNDPQDVTVDNNSNVYVASYICNSVVVLEPGGRPGRQLISSDDELSGPTGLHFDKYETSSLVSNYNRPAFLYHMC